MGNIWLTSLPDWFADAGLDVDVYDNKWTSRSRSSGGYEQVLGIGIHHDASSVGSSEQSACDWGWKNSPDRPIGAIRLARDGHITVGAAGATNTMGKGGPVKCSKGSVPKDQGNLYLIAIEAANNGVGEPWGSAMLDAYLSMVWVLCDELDLEHTDVWSHAGYCQPSCPGRKIDPAGPTPTYPNLGGTSGVTTWPDTAFRGYLDQRDGTHPPEPEPPPQIKDESMLFICKVDGTIYIGDGVRATEVDIDDEDTVQANVEGNGTARWRHPARKDLPILTRMADIPTINAGQRDCLVGKLD